MKRLKQIIAILCCTFTLISCAQDHKKNNQAMKNRPINRIHKLYNQKVKYPIMPQYFIEGYQSGCYYEILINDVLAFKHYENVGLMNHATPINDLILKSGPQKVTIKLFPLGKIDGKEYTTIDADDSFRLKIFKRDKKQPYVAGDYEVIKEHYAELKDGLPYYEETFTFDAEVPYQLKGWSESRVLTEMDQKKLEKEVLDFYKEYGEVLRNRDEEKWVNLVMKREKERIHAVDYFDKEDINIRTSEYINTFDNEVLEVQPLDPYKMTFYGDGRLITLRSLENLGDSAFFTIEQDEDENGKYKVYQFYYLFLHKPKDSDQLEIIR
ncbi:hypothetical protein [Aquimarina algicola]|uniref:Uncharacterized protein n=1 Tax=Aquimarina algicola TaxID=2589995 RepID=A0A504J937_9FLAO|nr:hypothetical protein [Aquimarina algicola]TPN87426.1 hypothetical protein FHK87_07540 [Aquimarina algicola]